jgi:sugar/nucleoside kinase (ribokinase family)
MRYELTPARPAGALGVIGNISRDLVAYPGGRTTELLGGAALYVALAATRAGLPATPVAVIGADLSWVTSDPRLAGVDTSRVKVVPGDSCAFALAYDEAGQVTSVTGSVGAAEAPTGHALSVLGSRPAWHVCCRRPLAAPLILDRLAASGVPFSADFHLASAAELMAAVRATMPRATVLFVNAAELAILASVIDLRELRMIVASDGPRPATVLRHGDVTASVAPPAVAVTELTGAGDTLAGTFLAAAARGLSDRDALDG